MNGMERDREGGWADWAVCGLVDTIEVIDLFVWLVAGCKSVKQGRWEGAR